MNPVQIIELLRIIAQLGATLKSVKETMQRDNPEAWAEVADDFNAASAAFNDGA